MSIRSIGLATVLATVGLSSSLYARGPALTAGFELGAATLKDTDPEIDNTFAGRLHADFSFPIIPWGEQLRLGLGASIEGAYEEGELVDPDDDDDTDHTYSQFSSFTPEISLAWSQPLGDKFFVEPSVALCMPVGYWSIGETHHNGSRFEDNDDDVRVGIGVRPAIAVGYNITERHAVGISASYFLANIDFKDDVGPEYHSFGVGAFYRFTF